MEKIKSRRVKNEKGLTLVELLVTLALLSLVGILATSVTIFSQKQMTAQQKEINTQTDERLAIKLLTKEIRNASSVTVEIDPTTNIKKLVINNTDKYWLDGSTRTLKKNQTIFVENISNFEPKMSGDQVVLVIGKIPETKIYIRK